MTWNYTWILLCGYLGSILIETPVLLLLLSPAHSWRRRLFAGVWLTACTYPVLGLVFPALVDPESQRKLYLLCGETWVAVTECFLFWLAFDQGRGYRHAYVIRDIAVVALANLTSFGLGELYNLGAI